MGFFTSRQHASTRLFILIFVYIFCNFVVFLYKKAKLEFPKHKTKNRGVTYSPVNLENEFGGPNDTWETSDNFPVPEPQLKTILFWNAFFKADDYKFGTGRKPFLDNGCVVNNCQTVTNRRLLKDADAVVFHGPRVEDFPPKIRPPGQKYVYIQEKPNYNPSVSHMGDFNNYMNITITNRRDSDIEFPHALITVDASEIKMRSQPYVDPSLRPRSIVWVVHRCATPSRREWYVKELKKYIDIDVFGKCGDKKCKETDDEEDQECLEFFEGKYRFYLALEYDVCRDYVSEKIYKAFNQQIIPIVFGGANYSYVAPPHSVIDIRNYPHPKSLAGYLNYLSRDEIAYNRYFNWKDQGYTIETGREEIMAHNFCELCNILHDDTYQYQTYKNIKNWWINGICDASEIPRMRRTEEW